MEQLTALANFNSLIEMLETLPTDTACREYLEGVIWKGTPACPHCKSVNSYKLTTKGIFNGQYKCGDCKERYNVKDGTMFEGTHIGLKKWFIAIYVFSLHKKGISSYQLASDLAITQQTAWYLLGRIRLAFKPASMRVLKGKIQCDETYVGGKTRNMHKAKRDMVYAAGTGAVHMNPVFGMVNEGNVIAIPVEETNGRTLQPIIMNQVERGATVVTDGHGAYAGLNRHFKHEVINHEAGEFARGQFNTNGIENFWSHLKRGIYGIYHHASGKHLHRYCDEFAFRYNFRKNTVNEKFNFPLQNSQRLMYKVLIAK